MAKSMFQLLFLTEVFLLVLSVPYKYVLVQQEKNWTDAQAYCKANYIDSAIPSSTDYIVKLQTEAEKQGFTSSAWIGLYNDMHWRWSLGNQSLGDFQNWCNGEPNYGMEFCVVLNPICWYDTPCLLLYPFVCFDDRNTGSSRFINISTTMTFRDAQTYCRQFHTDLASVTSLEESSIIQSIINDYYWIGLFRDGWEWTDQSILTGWPWGVNPGSVSPDYICGSFINGIVDPEPCSNIKPFFCLRDFTRRVSIRINIKSCQDVNDPAMKADILQKFKQKLEERRISQNITINWREKADGMVFQKIKINGL